MKIQIQTIFRTQYTRLATRATKFYHRALQWGGLEDNDTNRVMAGIVVCVVLWYTIIGIAAIANLIQASTHTITAAIVTQ